MIGKRFGKLQKYVDCNLLTYFPPLVRTRSGSKGTSQPTGAPSRVLWIFIFITFNIS